MAARRVAPAGRLTALRALASVHAAVFLALGVGLLALAAGFPLLAAGAPLTGYIAALRAARSARVARDAARARALLAGRLGADRLPGADPLVWSRLGVAASPSYGRLFIPASAGILLGAGAVAAAGASGAAPGLPGALLVLATMAVGLLAGPRLARAGGARLAPPAVETLARIARG